MKKRLNKKPVSKPVKAEPEEKPLPRGSVRMFRVGSGLPNISQINEELLDYRDVLMGRVEAPVKVRGTTLALQEVADAYYARAMEIKMDLQRLEREGHVIRGSGHYKFMRGELQTFIDICRKASDLGSRRLTEATLRADSERRGRDYDM